MDGFEFNKILASILVALLVALLGSFLSEWLIHPETLEPSEIQIALPADLSKKEEDKAVVLEPIQPFMATANRENGQKIAVKKCAQCHTFQKGEKAKIGPNLWSIVGKAVAQATEYAYSASLKAWQGNKWTHENLSTFLYQPRQLVKGTKMTFPGLSKAQERADVITYLETLKD